LIYRFTMNLGFISKIFLAVSLFLFALSSRAQFNFFECAKNPAACQPNTTNLRSEVKPDKPSKVTIEPSTPPSAAVLTHLPACPVTQLGSQYDCIGEQTLAEGVRYEGEIRRGSANGLGTLFIPNGDKYVGQVRNGMRHGEGVQYTVFGSVRQSGIWIDDRFDSYKKLNLAMFPFDKAIRLSDRAKSEALENGLTIENTNSNSNSTLSSLVNQAMGQSEVLENTRRKDESEFRLKEQERVLADRNAKEQARLIEEARAKDDQRRLDDARVQQQLKLAEEARVRAESEARAKEQERVLAESKAKERERQLAESKDAELSALRAQLEKMKQQSAKSSEAVQMAKRKALIIGNDSYKFISKLANAREDARAVAENLAKVGYTVTLKTDLTEKEMKAAIRTFKSQVEAGDEVAIFYAGHGIQLENTNYLIPIDVAGDAAEQVKDEAIPLQRVLDDMADRKAKLTLALIDACRDNPFKSAGRSIGQGRGLAPTTAATGQMVVFSAGTGQQALDNLGPSDKEKNGIFTRIFIREMTKPDRTVDAVVRQVRNEVVRMAKSVGHEQVPAIYDQVVGEFYFSRSGQ